MFENIEVTNPKHVEWIKMVNEQRESGLTIKEWCRRKHLSKNTFYYRKKRLHVRNAYMRFMIMSQRYHL